MPLLTMLQGFLGFSCLSGLVVAAAERPIVVACRELQAELGNFTTLPWQSQYLSLSTENWYVSSCIPFFSRARP